MNRTRESLILLTILTVGLSLRGLYLAEIVHKPDFSSPGLDAGYHDYWARGLVTGDWSLPVYVTDPEIQTTPFFRPPGYPYFLALVYRIVGPDYLAIRALQMALGAVNILLAFLLGRRWFGPRVGLTAAALMSVYWVFPYFEGQLLEPVLLVGLGLAMVHVLSSWTARFSFGRALAAGLLFGLFVLIRPNVLPFGLAALLWAWWIARRHPGRTHRWATAAAGFVLGAAVAISPATVRNYAVGHDRVLVSANGGVNLFLGNNEYADGFTPDHPDIGGWSCFDYPSIVRKLEREAGRTLRYSEASSLFARKAAQFARTDPLRVLQLALKKTLLFWGPVEVSNEEEDECERANSRILRRIPVGFPLALTLFVLGLGIMIRESRATPSEREAPSREQWEAIVLMLLFVGVYFLSFVPFFIAGRYRVPIIPFLLLIGSYGLERLVRWAGRREGRKVMNWVYVGMVAYLLASINVTGYAPNWAVWHYFRGVASGRTGRADAAEKEYREAMRLKADYVEPRLNLATLLQTQGKTNEAIELLSEALHIRPSLYEAHNNLGAIFFTQGNRDMAIAHFSEAVRLNPESASARDNLGKALAHNGLLDAAVAQLREAVRLRPRFAEAYYHLGLALYQQKKTTEAAACFAEALKANPDSAEAHNLLGAILAEQKQTREALGHFEKALQLKPGFGEAHFHLGLALLQQGRIDEATTHLREAVRIDPKDAEARYNLGYVLAVRGDREKALREQEEALRLEPDMPEAHHQMALLLLLDGQAEKSLAHFARAIALKPDQAQWLNDLAWVLASHAGSGIRDPHEAIRLSERACLLTSPPNPEFLDTLAVAYASAGRYAEAVRQEEQALKIIRDAGKNPPDDFSRRLDLFRNHRPYREETPP